MISLLHAMIIVWLLLFIMIFVALVFLFAIIVKKIFTHDSVIDNVVRESLKTKMEETIDQLKQMEGAVCLYLHNCYCKFG